MSVVSVLCCQVEVFASGRSLVQGIPTERGVSECDRGVSLIRSPCSTVGTCLTEEKKLYKFYEMATMFPNLSQSRRFHTFTNLCLQDFFEYHIPIYASTTQPVPAFSSKFSKGTLFHRFLEQVKYHWTRFRQLKRN